MNILYKIIENFPEKAQIVVRYYSDTVTEFMLGGVGPNGEFLRGHTDVALDLPHPIPEGQVLIDFIMDHAQFVYEKLVHAEEYYIKGIRSPIEDLPLNVEFEGDTNKKVVINNGKVISSRPEKKHDFNKLVSSEGGWSRFL